ncbi:MAG: hypothetical protein IJD77_03895 [Clostridia bacterium]|nr:hypothetical protein [Clostridia bacterium]
MKLSKWKVLLLGLTASFTVAAAVGISGLVDFNAQEVGAHSLQMTENIRERYVVGERLVVPNGKINVAGTDYDATFSVLTPSGKAYKTAEMILTENGQYSIKYSAEVNGKIYTQTVYFEVNKEMFSVNGNNSTFSYADGQICVDLTEGEELTCNVPIDLRKMTDKDTLVSVYVTAAQMGVRDFEEYVLKLTDAYDSENAVYIRVLAAPDYELYCSDPETYYNHAYSQYQSYVGVNFNDLGNWASNYFGTITSTNNGTLGTPVAATFANKTYNDVAIGDELLQFSFDYETQRVYVGSNLYGGLVADLDDPAYFPEGWKGFTDGLCYLSIYANDVESTAKLVMKDIAGLDDSKAIIVDETSPALIVDFAEYTENTIPCGVIGEPYKIFTATALDENITDKNAKCQIYYNYATSNKTLIAVQDGAFIPEYEGVYTLVYTATDSFGNKAEKVVNVKVVDEALPLAFEVASETGIAGVMTPITKPDVATFDERMGKPKLTVTISRGEINDVVYDGLLENFESVDYCFMRTGEWKIAYTLSDYSRSVTKDVLCNVVSDKNVIFTKFEDLIMDKYFVSGNTYILPDVEVAAFTDEKAEYATAKMKVVYDGGKTEQLTSNLFTPNAESGSKVTIVYYDETDESVFISGEKEIYSIMGEGGLDMSKLFISNEAQISASSNCILAKMTKNSTIALLNKQDTQNFSVVFNLLENSGEFNTFHMVLTDAEDENIQVKLTFKNLHNAEFNEYGNVYVYVNNDFTTPYASTCSFSGLTSERFNIKYRNAINTFTVGKTSIVVDKMLNGDIFEGFPSKTVYVTFESELLGDGQAEFYSVNSQTLSVATGEQGKPVITTLTNYSSSYRMNEVMNTSIAFGIDVIGGYSQTTITLLNYETGEKVKTLDGQVISGLDASVSYEVKLDSYGEYLVRYNTVDRFGNKSVIAYSFWVEDDVPPTIEIVGNVQKVATVKSHFIMPEGYVWDDASVGEVFVIIRDPYGKDVCIDVSKGYTFTKKGTHKITLGVFDGNGNMATVVYYVEVV